MKPYSSVLPGYEPLASVLNAALEQAQSGKGKERHATGQPFEEQPIITISELLGSHIGDLFQAIKKAQESTRLKPGPAVHELLGAINYLAAAVIILQREEAKEVHGPVAPDDAAIARIEKQRFERGRTDALVGEPPTEASAAYQDGYREGRNGRAPMSNVDPNWDPRGRQ